MTQKELIQDHEDNLRAEGYEQAIEDVVKTLMCADPDSWKIRKVISQIRTYDYSPEEKE